MKSVFATLFALLVAVVLNACVTTAAAAPAATRDGQHIVVTLVRGTVYVKGEVNPHMTGPVSRVCNERDHFEYHNEDRVQCGEGVVVKVEKDTDTITATQPELELPVIDDGGETLPDTDIVVEDDDDDTDVVVEDDDDDTSVVVDDDDDDKSNNGNHYGNDQPDNNANDDQNKHDGEQTAEDHHDNNTKNDNNKDKSKKD